MPRSVSTEPKGDTLGAEGRANGDSAGGVDDIGDVPNERAAITS
jgi:hypothetical protein